MLTYDQLDSIADSINPLLLAVTLIMPWIPRVRGTVQPFRWIASIVCVAVIVYGMQFLDKTFGLWSHWNGDYSTHSAVAIALVALWFFASVIWFSVGIVVFCLYAALMVYQKYHTWADILSTALVIGLIAWGIGAALVGRRQSGQ